MEDSLCIFSPNFFKFFSTTSYEFICLETFFLQNAKKITNFYSPFTDHRPSPPPRNQRAYSGRGGGGGYQDQQRPPPPHQSSYQQQQHRGQVENFKQI